MRRLIVVLLVLVAGSLFLAGCGSDAGEPASVQSVEMKLFIRNATPPVQDSFNVGDVVRIKDSGTALGEITAVEALPTLQAVPDAEGRLHEAESPILVDIMLTIEGEANVSERGYRFDGELVYVNNDIKYLTPLVQFGGIITEMKVLGDPS